MSAVASMMGARDGAGRYVGKLKDLAEVEE